MSTNESMGRERKVKGREEENMRKETKITLLAGK